ncbi:MAG: outer membrane protein assembly factor BamD [Bacteroidetes bacterium]|nr:outer membrane protein assembly factor BamD [Bacteroidota bacterium]
MRNKQFYILFLALLGLALYSCNTKERVYDSTGSTKKKRFDVTVGKFNKLVKSSDMDAKYNAAVKYFEKEEYTKALTLFEELMGVYRGTSKAEEVHYYYAYCSYNLEDYIVAGYQFKSFVRNFPTSKHTEECAYMNAYCYYLNSPEYSLDQIDTKLAIKEFQHFTNLYPQSTHIPECNDLLDNLRGKLERKSYENAMLYYNMSDYKASIVSFGNHLKEFPGSKHDEELNYLIIRSYYLYALNSIESKKQERFKAAVDHYIKFLDTYPKSEYLKEAEMVYSSALKNLEKYNKPT